MAADQYLLASLFIFRDEDTEETRLTLTYWHLRTFQMLSHGTRSKPTIFDVPESRKRVEEANMERRHMSVQHKEDLSNNQPCSRAREPM